MENLPSEFKQLLKYDVKVSGDIPNNLHELISSIHAHAILRAESLTNSGPLTKISQDTDND